MSANWMCSGSKWSGVSNVGAVLKRNFATEATVSEVRPVADFTIADARDVRKAVATHVGNEDRLRTVGEYDRRGPDSRPRA